MDSKSDIYQLVIQEEIKAQNLYIALTKALDNEALNRIFTNLIQIEKIHEEKITELFRAEFPKLKLEIDRDLLPELKNTDYLESPESALNFAIRKEEAAEEIYLELAAKTKTKDMKKLFEKFASDERNHKLLLEDEILRMDGLMTWFDASELNGMMEY
ncbi:MAG: ferritin family protein [Candidatus Cloacimonadales bacterium]|nr:ferritin family protein [Candidatus Cloacimonadales bacterium]